MEAMSVKMEGSKEVKTFLSGLPEHLFGESKIIFQKSAFSITNKIKTNATNILKVRTGHLKRSIGSKVSGTKLSTLNMSIYAAGKVGAANVVYAPIHEFGGTIRAKNAYRNVPGGPYLNIPAPDNKTPAGVMRMSARQVFAQGGHIGGKVVWLGDKPMFFLVKSVKIKARLGMVDAANEEIPTMLTAFKNMPLEG